MLKASDLNHKDLEPLCFPKIYSQSNCLSLKLHTHPAEVQHKAEDEDMKSSLLTLPIPHILSPKHTNPCMQSPSPNPFIEESVHLGVVTSTTTKPIHKAASTPHQART